MDDFEHRCTILLVQRVHRVATVNTHVLKFPFIRHYGNTFFRFSNAVPFGEGNSANSFDCSLKENMCLDWHFLGSCTSIGTKTNNIYHLCHRDAVLKSYQNKLTPAKKEKKVITIIMNRLSRLFQPLAVAPKNAIIKSPDITSRSQKVYISFQLPGNVFLG